MTVEELVDQLSRMNPRARVRCIWIVQNGTRSFTPTQVYWDSMLGVAEIMVDSSRHEVR